MSSKLVREALEKAERLLKEREWVFDRAADAECCDSCGTWVYRPTDKAHRPDCSLAADLADIRAALAALDEPSPGGAEELADRLDRDENHSEFCGVHLGITCTCPTGDLAADIRSLPRGLSEEDREFIHGAANLLERLGEDFDAEGLRAIAGRGE